MRTVLVFFTATLFLVGWTAPYQVKQRGVAKLMLDGRPWPLDAQGNYAEGTPVLFGLVDENGQMIEACILQSSGNASLDSEAVRKIARLRFDPGRRNGKPVKGYARIPVPLYVDGSVHPIPPLRSTCQTQPITGLEQ
jgi:TonB family protein